MQNVQAIPYKILKLIIFPVKPEVIKNNHAKIKIMANICYFRNSVKNTYSF